MKPVVIFLVDTCLLKPTCELILLNVLRSYLLDKVIASPSAIGFL